MKLNRKIFIFSIFLGVFLFLLGTQAVFAVDPLGFDYADDLGLENEDITDPRDLIVNIVQFLLSFIGLIAVVMFMYGGWLWMTAAGNPDRVQKAKKTLISATIGIIIVLSAYMIVSYIVNNLLDDLGVTGCTENATRACGCGGLETCVGGSWGGCVGSDCSYNSGQIAFRVRDTLPDDEDTGVIRNMNTRVFLNKAVDPNMTQVQINENFTIERIERDVDPETLVGTVIANELIPLEDIFLLSGDQTLGALASAACGDERGTTNCLPEWSRFRVSINDGVSDITAVDSQDLSCSNNLCHFEFVTDDTIDTATPTVNIIPTQVCRGVAGVDLEADANTVGAWARDDVGVLEMRYYHDSGAGNVLDYNEPGNGENYQYYAHQYDASGYAVGINYRFTVEADDMAGDTANDDFEAIIREGHCCNGELDPGEEDIDCGGPDCESCTMRDPMILAFNPDNGAEGNWITIVGRYFGTQTGSVYFSDGSGAWVGPAQFPSDVNANCSNDWSNRQIVVVVPPGAASGPLRIVRQDNREDYTNNDYGPPLDDFTVNATVRPGLCLADPASGYFEDTSLLQGTRFDPLPHEVYFGTSTFQAVSSAWTNSSVLAEVPNLAAGRTSIFVEAGGEQSNYLDFRVQVDTSFLPVIDYIDDSSGPIGSYITIYGSNFMSFLNGTSQVEFNDGVNVELADGFSFPEECQGRWWNDTFIVVKVPTGIDLGTANVRVTNRNSLTSLQEEFDVVAGDPGPGICLLDPHNGLPNSEVDIYGDNLDDGTVDLTVRWHNNESQTRAETNSWDNESINTNVPIGAQSGPVRVINGNLPPETGVSNSLNFQVGPCSIPEDPSDPSDCYPTEECCGEETAWPGICRLIGDCGASSADATGYGWSFTTGAGSGAMTCGGNSSRAACDAAGTCPNSPGTCQTTTDLDLDRECSDLACESQFLVCASGACNYNAATNYCELSADTCQSSIAGWDDASCNTVEGRALWQVNQPNNCPANTYLDSNNWCTIGTLGNPTVCDVCAQGAICLNDTCVVPQQVCPENSSCDAGQCVLDYEVCECCCEVGQSERDCCLGLECRSGGCGNDPAYGECTGCRVENNGNPNDVSVTEQILSDEACNCNSTQGKYCSIANPADPNDRGACKDAPTCDGDPYTESCDIDNTRCDPGYFCDDDCFCRAAKPCDTDDNVGNGCNDQPNCDPATEYCDLSDCYCKPGRSCDGNLTNNVCDQADMCEADEVCNSDCLCVPAPVPPGDPCDQNPTPGPTNVDCDPNHCTAGYECETYDPANEPCGFCCCDMNNDNCSEVNPNLFCANDYDVSGNCHDTTPGDGTDYGLCCGCTADSECGDPSLSGCGNDTCCRARPNVESVFPADMPPGTGTVCRNTAIEARFDSLMDVSSFSSNIIVFGDYGIDQCPAGTTYLAGQPAQNGRIAKVYYKTLDLIGRGFGELLPDRFVSAFTIPDSATNYCAITGSASGWRAANGNSVMSFAPQVLLDGDRTYYAVIKGDAALDSNTGVRSIDGIGLNASAPGVFQSPSGGVNNSFNGITYTNAYIWSFQTMDDLELCEIDRVSVEPASYLFRTTENSVQENDGDSNHDTFDRYDDSDKVFRATALDNQGGKIVSISGVYEFDWLWSIADNLIAQEIPVAGLPENQILVRADADIVDGRTTVTATANSTNLAPQYTAFSMPGSADVYIFLCDNPWPPIDGLGNWRPWRDDTQGMDCIGGLAGCHNTNYEIYYCRDAGGPGTFDDLPAINSDNTVNRNESDIECSLQPGSCAALNVGDSCGPDNQGVCTRVLKESFFFRENIPDISLITLAGSENNEGGVDLNWGNIPGAFIPAGETIDHYKVYYGTRSGNYDSERVVSLIESHTPAMPYVIDGLDSGQTYYFVATAVYVSSAESDLSNELVLTPEDRAAYAPPLGVTATPRDSEVELSWTEVTGAESYVLYYGVADNTGRSNADRVYGSSQNIGSDTQVIVSGLTNGQTYYFALTSVDENDQESIYSAEVSAVPDTLAVGFFGSGEVVLTWNTGGGGASYNVYYSVIE